MISECWYKVAQCDLRSIFLCKPRQAVRAAPRTNAAGDADHNERIEARRSQSSITNVRFLFFFVKRRPSPASAVYRPVEEPPRAQNGRLHGLRLFRDHFDDPKHQSLAESGDERNRKHCVCVQWPEREDFRVEIRIYDKKH
jgi:hypothetical protein